MREIKFRAWNEFNKVMIPPEELEIIDYDGHIVAPYNIGDGCMRFHPIMQYLGPKDGKGVEIFEGDIVRFHISNHENNVAKHGMNPRRWDFIIEVKHGCVGYRGSIPSLHHEDDLNFRCVFDNEEGEATDFNDTKIIGNIYNNPELLNND